MTYAQNMDAWEREQDEKYWKQRFDRAVSTIDTSHRHEIEDLVAEGIELGYDIPIEEITDKILYRIVKCAIVACQ